MKPWLWLLAITLVAVPICLWQTNPTSSADASTKPFVPSSTRLVGAGSCAAAACHNANFVHGQAGSEFTHWMTRDRHAKAYEILFERDAQKIQAKLQAKEKPHQDQRCLRCHVHPDYDTTVELAIPGFASDGVSCESCHGAAQHWLASHYQTAWKSLSVPEKQARGMNDTQSTLGRARTCVKCHVGAAGMEVDHDLIAAGHPRLHFEFASFHAAMPRHWPDAKDYDPRMHARGQHDFEARAWALGQLAAAQASLELLVHRTEEKHVNWPEFAEFDCSSCHHKLETPNPRPKTGFGKRKAGGLPWGHSVALTPSLLQSKADAELRNVLAALQEKMDKGNPKQQEVHEQALLAAFLLNERLKDLDQSSIAPDKAMEHYLAKKVEPSAKSDEWTQARLGVIALSQAHVRIELSPDIRSRIFFAPVQEFDPDTVRHRIERAQRINAKTRP